MCRYYSPLLNQFNTDMFTESKLRKMTNIVFLDQKTIGKVDNLKLLSKLGKLDTHESTQPEQVVERCKGKEIVIVNKVEMTEEVLFQRHL